MRWTTSWGGWRLLLARRDWKPLASSESLSTPMLRKALYPWIFSFAVPGSWMLAPLSSSLIQPNDWPVVILSNDHLRVFLLAQELASSFLIAKLRQSVNVVTAIRGNGVISRERGKDHATIILHHLHRALPSPRESAREGLLLLYSLIVRLGKNA